MRVLISTDIEGVAGIYHRVQTTPGNPEYERARVLMTREANAAVAGAFDGGARAVLVNDSHGDFRNMPPDLLDPRAQAVQGKPRPLGMMAGIDQDIDAVCLVGYHARASGRGILAHTVNSFAFARIAINGQELGEAGLYGALAGAYGVPVAMASGDDVFVAENRALLPGTRFVETKRATGQNSGISLSPAQSCAAIGEAVAAALRESSARSFRLEGPLEVRVRAQTPALADLFCLWPSLRRGEGSEVVFAAAHVAEAVQVINALSAMSSALR
ncbi:M55 family metallopeptidase [Methylobacterium radiotolerans]|uniref:Peptidase M55 D-aminopeptidase n=1 Tax=Methylobacterium radiotolerans (strain ATCC 27329 / DSM 1819 / JCM 2831 / NBRC 15690 / NCIMB 10815 / 0-1) TaxID=426355 RepID=B1M7R6_METRJ|nr:M55 family metallopeptidase [Methylobacterium radiotolerans]ACB25219.1 peptidase M55 D-aminopeptidase [Methylobacterium radiotolerans JCM 2831]GEM96481.1 transporter [Methylobacterium radiotolerans]